MKSVLVLGLIYLVGINICFMKNGVRTEVWEGTDDSRQYNSFEKVPAKSRLHLKGSYHVLLSAVPRAQHVSLGASLILHCKLRGKQRPLAAFMWEKDGIKLFSSSRRQIRTRLRSERLKIKSLKTTDSGRYRCLAIAHGQKWLSNYVKVSFKGTRTHATGFEQRSAPRSQERCEPYRGTVCVDNLNSRGDVFIRQNENQNEIEHLLKKNLRHVMKLMSPECYPTVLRIVCVSLFPPCRHVNHTATPMRVCKESCLQIQRSYCTKGLSLLRHMKMIQSVIDGSCGSLPEIDSNELCARVASPARNYKNMLCKRRFRLKALRSQIHNNRMEQVSDSTAICGKVSWKPMHIGARYILEKALPNVTILSGRFAKLAGNVYCYHLPLKVSDILDNKDIYERTIGLPSLSQTAFDEQVQGLSVRIRNGGIKQLLVPLGFLKEYHLDRMLTIPNVTIYYYKDPKMAKIFGKGVFNLCGTEFKIQIEQTKPHVTLLSGQSPHPVDLRTIELAFGFRQPASDLIAIMKQFRILRLRLTNPKLNILWDDENGRTMRFSGLSYYNGWGSVEVNVELLLGNDRSFWAAGISTVNRSFKEIFGILAGMRHVRLAKLLDMALDVDKVGFILATQDVKIPKYDVLKFQHEPVKTMASKSVSNGFTLEAHANVKDSCKKNDNKSFICQLIQLATGIKATTKIHIRSNSNAMILVLNFGPDGEIPNFSVKALSKIRKTWKLIDPFNRVPESNVQITENRDQTWRSMPRYRGAIWLRKLEVTVQYLGLGELFESSIVQISADVVVLNRRFTYKISNVGLSYCLRLLDSITETLKQCKSFL